MWCRQVRHSCKGSVFFRLKMVFTCAYWDVFSGIFAVRLRLSLRDLHVRLPFFYTRTFMLIHVWLLTKVLFFCDIIRYKKFKWPIGFLWGLT